MNTDERGFDSLTERVLGAVFEVSNTLGSGFLEKVYERALLRELAIQGIQAASQASLAVKYKGTMWAITLLISWSKIYWSSN